MGCRAGRCADTEEGQQQGWAGGRESTRVRGPELWLEQTGGGQEYLLRLNATRESGPGMGSTGWEGREGPSLDSLSQVLGIENML